MLSFSNSMLKVTCTQHTEHMHAWFLYRYISFDSGTLVPPRV